MADVKVHGIIRRSSSFNTARIEHLYENPWAFMGGGMYVSCAVFLLGNELALTIFENLTLASSNLSFCV